MVLLPKGGVVVVIAHGSLLRTRYSSTNVMCIVVHIDKGLGWPNYAKPKQQRSLERYLFPLVRGEILGTRVCAWRGALSFRGVYLLHGLLVGEGLVQSSDARSAELRVASRKTRITSREARYATVKLPLNGTVLHHRS